MKAFTLFFFFLSASVPLLSAASGHFFTCREYKLDPKMEPERLIAYDLTHGLWMPEGEPFRSIQFYEDGTAISFYSSDDITTVSFLVWSVASVNGLTHLSVLNSSDGSLQQYAVSINCEGLSLLNTVTYEVQQMHYRPVAASSKLSEIKADLCGEWTAYAGQIRHGEPQAIRIFFEKNQEYTRLLDMGNIEKPERGFWEISKDGNYLLFHACRRNQPTVCESTTVYRIVYCDDHSLQLQQVSVGLANQENRRLPSHGLLSFVK